LVHTFGVSEDIVGICRSTMKKKAKIGSVDSKNSVSFAKTPKKASVRAFLFLVVILYLLIPVRHKTSFLKIPILTR
jgi:hypothetical protein